MISYRRVGRGRVDASKSIGFSFDGNSYNGLAGDTVASALLANGVHFVGRSFKYHRPRGFMSAGSEEANGLFVFDRGPGRVTGNMRGTTLELFEGLTVRSQNAWPSLAFDVAAANDVFSAFFPAGFYNKTFMWPRSFWEALYEPAIRRTAGLGPAPSEPDADLYAGTYGHCETLIVGGGAAGIAAALSASQDGSRVILADEQQEIGGDLLSSPHAEINNLPAWGWLKQSLAELSARSNVVLLPRTTAIGYYHDNFVGLVERVTDHIQEIDPKKPRERLHRIRAKKVVLATGAIERPLTFVGNDRPGVMLASSARTYLNRYGVAVGNDVVVFTSHDSAYETAFDLADANTRIGAIIDTRRDVPEALLASAAKRGIPVHNEAAVVGTRGRLRVSSLTFARVSNANVVGSPQKLSCDCLLMCGGWTPSVHLWSHSRGTLQWREEIGAYVPARPAENTVSAGACNGAMTLAAALEEGNSATMGSATYSVTGGQSAGGAVFDELSTVRNGSRLKAFVDFQNDVTAKDIKLAVREGFRSIEHIKRYTTNGMATDQGKTSNINGLRIASSAVQRPVTDVGLTTFRPPYTPTTFGALVGHNANDTFEVTRKTPMDAWAEERGAVFEPVSLWRRARYFPDIGEDMHAAVARECRATRSAVGIFDASTLGKIEVVGPDAAEFMNRMYTNPWSKLAPGRCRYGLMLNEDGYIQDDGVVGRLAHDRFHVTTTTGGAPRVLAKMEDYLQTEWTDLDLWLTSTTEQWAVIAISGPKARKVIEPFVEGIDLSPESFPHMAVREGKICGIETRLFRVSFNGELGFEVNVPSNFGRAVWQTLFDHGQSYGITPYGTETMHVLRAEKGFIIVGQDTDGTVTPDDAGLGWAVGKRKSDFVGKRSLTRPDIVSEGRKQLVGLFTDDPKVILEEGAQVVRDPSQPTPMDMIGHVTSSYRSATLDRSIAMALIKDGRAREGERVHIPMKSGVLTAVVGNTLFFDPEGTRLDVV